MEAGQLYYQANEALQAGRPQEAQGLYHKLLSIQGENGAVHYNLGTAYFRDGQIGQSIYHLRKAKELLPRDGDVEFNLNYTRKGATDHIESKPNFLTTTIDNNYPLNFNESSYFFVTSLLIVTALSIVILFKKSDLFRWVQRAAATIFMLAALGTCYKYYNVDPFGVVTSSLAKVYSGKGTNNVLLFNLHEGAEFTVELDEEKWLRIVLADGKKGWIAKKDVVR